MNAEGDFGAGTDFNIRFWNDGENLRDGRREALFGGGMIGRMHQAGLDVAVVAQLP